MNDLDLRNDAIDDDLTTKLNNINVAMSQVAEVFNRTLIPAIASINASAERFVKDVEQEIVIPFVSNFGKSLTLLFPERWDDETLVEWANRLEDAGIWDKPDIRWMYQKECLRVILFAPYHWVKGWIVGVRS